MTNNNKYTTIINYFFLIKYYSFAICFGLKYLVRSIQFTDMKLRHVLLLATITFIWIWSLPILVIGSIIMLPGFWLMTSVFMVIGMTIQILEQGVIEPNHWIRRIVSDIPWNEWFPCNTLHFEEGVIASGPHGILCCGTLAGIHFVRGSKTCMCIAPIVFYVPIIGLLARKLGCIPADYRHMKLALSMGLPVLVVPGGVPEIVMMEAADDHLKFKRHGFLQIASEMDATVHAVHVRGECNTYKLFKGPFFQTRIYLSWRLNVPVVMPIILGYYGTWIPKRTPLKLLTCKIDGYDTKQYQIQLQQLTPAIDSD